MVSCGVKALRKIQYLRNNGKNYTAIWLQNIKIKSKKALGTTEMNAIRGFHEERRSEMKKSNNE